MPAALRTRPTTKDQVSGDQPPTRRARRDSGGRHGWGRLALIVTAIVAVVALAAAYAVTTDWRRAIGMSQTADATAVGSSVPSGQAPAAPLPEAGAPSAAASAQPPASPSAPAGAGSSSPVGAPTGSKTIVPMAYMNEDAKNKPSASEAVALAKQFGVIVALPGQLGSNMPAMKRANPSLLLLGYLNGTYAQSYEATKYPDSWYARTASGNKIRSLGYGNYLMRPDNPGWKADRAKACKKLIASGYHGCMLDMVGPAPVTDGYNDGKPASGGRVFSVSQWLGFTGALGQAVKAANPGQAIWGNGYSSGRRYFSSEGSSKPLGSKFDMLLSESWIRTSGQSVTARVDEAVWKASIDQIADLEARGRGTAAMVKIWSGGSTSEKNAEAEWATASFLLAAGKRSVLAVTYGSKEDPTLLQPVERFAIGKPAGDRQRTGKGVWKRMYSGGMVLVNPTRATVTVPLGGTYTGLDGRKVTSVTLPPASGKLLRRG